jgi:hypothetical protein
MWGCEELKSKLESDKTEAINIREALCKTHADDGRRLQAARCEESRGNSQMSAQFGRNVLMTANLAQQHQQKQMSPSPAGPTSDQTLVWKCVRAATITAILRQFVGNETGIIRWHSDSGGSVLRGGHSRNNRCNRSVSAASYGQLNRNGTSRTVVSGAQCTERWYCRR